MSAKKWTEWTIWTAWTFHSPRPFSLYSPYSPFFFRHRHFLGEIYLISYITLCQKQKFRMKFKHFFNVRLFMQAVTSPAGPADSFELTETNLWRKFFSADALRNVDRSEVNKAFEIAMKSFAERITEAAKSGDFK